MSRPATGKVKVNIYLDENVLEAVRRIGAARGMTYSECLRDAARRYVHAEAGKVIQEAVELKKIVP